jgi:hypothetical protein
MNGIKATALATSLAASLVVGATGASAATLNFDNTTSVSSNNPFTGASGSLMLTFMDTALVGVASVFASVTNTTGVGTAFGAGATISTLTGVGFDFLTGVTYVSNSFLGGSIFDTLILGADAQPFDTLDIAIADNNNYNGGNANNGLSEGSSDTASFRLNYTDYTNAAALDAAFGSAFAAGTLQASMRFQQVNAGAGSDKLNYAPSVVPLPAAGWLLLASIAGLFAAKRRKMA